MEAAYYSSGGMYDLYDEQDRPIFSPPPQTTYYGGYEEFNYTWVDDFMVDATTTDPIQPPSYQQQHHTAGESRWNNHPHPAPPPPHRELHRSMSDTSHHIARLLEGVSEPGRSDEDNIHSLACMLKSTKSDERFAHELLRAQDHLNGRDPWDLANLRLDAWLSKPWETTGQRTTSGAGIWNEKRDRFTAIRGRSGHGQSHDDYAGAKRTYRFLKSNGRKTKWLMDEYYLLNPHNQRPGLVLHEDMVLRRVYQETDVANLDDPGKRRKLGSSAANTESEVWRHLIKIFDKADMLKYAVCPDCDRIFCAPSKNGTTNLKRHIGSCSCERQHPDPNY